MRGALLIFALVGAACDCGKLNVTPVAVSVRVTPSQIDFGRIVLGQVKEQAIEVINESQVSVGLSWSLTGDGFLMDDALPSSAAVGNTAVSIRCAPPREGALDGLLRLDIEGHDAILIPLACEGVAPPQCLASGPCLVSEWSSEVGRCVERLAAEGTPCGAQDQCLIDGACHAGRCEGTVRPCDDVEPCTADTCHPDRGCQHDLRTTCPGEGPCRVGKCTAGIGCELEDAPDGTACGPKRSCVEADVCIGGECVVRDPPDGFACAPEGPCGGAGRCEHDTCVAATPGKVNPSWVRVAESPDGGEVAAWSDVFADRSEALVLSSYFASPIQLRANQSDSVALDRAARRCIRWLGWVVCGDYPASQTSPIVAIDPQTGQTIWSFSAAATLIPEFAGPSVQYFTARLAVLSENELLALYEARTLTADGADPRCRQFAMVVIDRQGQGLRGQRLGDPLFTACEHPHSYGVAVDAQSNIYLAFTVSGIDNPATSLTGTTFFSYSPALQVRWVQQNPWINGGELTVADGLLFQERGVEVRSAATGVIVGTWNSTFGLGVVGSHTAVANRIGGRLLDAMSTPQLTSRWQRTLDGNLGIAPLTLASWQSPWGPREVVLAFTVLDVGVGQVQLEATELETGAPAFSCPVALPRVPLITVITQGGMGMMWPGDPSSATLCDNCDPKYARTTNHFGWFPLPGLSVSSSAWSGAWGDEGHSHRERAP